MVTRILQTRGGKQGGRGRAVAPPIFFKIFIESFPKLPHDQKMTENDRKMRPRPTKI